jgi:NADPH-dependent curcumin reductase CurA
VLLRSSSTIIPPTPPELAVDNVNGPILNLMFKRMARFSRIVACGAISTYNSNDVVDLRN